MLLNSSILLILQKTFMFRQEKFDRTKQQAMEWIHSNVQSEPFEM
jgi:hypothetical protein